MLVYCNHQLVSASCNFRPLGFLQQGAVEFPVWADLGIKCSVFGTFSVVKITIMICSSAQLIKAKPCTDELSNLLLII